jgi:SAM-dependent methyltransferase
MDIRPLNLEDLLPRLRCPRSGGRLIRVGETLRSEGSEFVYPIVAGVPDLRHPPTRLALDLPWHEPWEELARLTFERPEPLDARDLPHHIDRDLASILGSDGHGQWLLELGCGERRCEPYLAARNYRYVGADVDLRGIGPHVRVDAHNLPFQDHAFDLYLSLAVYEHLQCPLLAALEGLRVLRPGGLFVGTAAFVYGFHDRASFHHMTHAGLLWTLRSAGFEVLRLWPDWTWTQSIPQMAFGGGSEGLPWRIAARASLAVLEWSFTRASNLARRLAGKHRLDLPARAAAMAGSLTFVARRPERPAARPIT